MISNIYVSAYMRGSQKVKLSSKRVLVIVKIVALSNTILFNLNTAFLNFFNNSNH